MAKVDPNDQQEDPVEKQSDDQADEENPGVEDGEDDGTEEEEDDATGDDDDDDSESDDDEEKEVNLVSDDEYNKLKDDPAALRKALNTAATKKFQDLSAQKKALKPYAAFISSFEQDSVAATVELAKQLGIEVKLPKRASEAEAEELVEDIGKRISKKVKAALGPEYEDLADKLAVAIHGAAEELVEEKVKPLKQGQQELMDDAAQTAANQSIKAFSKKYPGWDKHEKAMTALSKKLLPGKGMNYGEYLESLYLIVTKDGKAGDRLKKTVEKMTRNVRENEGKSRTVSDKTVSNNPGRNLSFREAGAMALRGERLDD